jgi:putative colanic acid biosynthesis acetyltransferase WcaF
MSRTTQPNTDVYVKAPELPVDARHVSPYSIRENVMRLLWAIVQATFFRFSYTTSYRYRAWMLNLFGAEIHPTCHIRRTARFECPWNVTAGRNCAIGDFAIIYALGPITLGDRVSISQYAHLCAGSHDFRYADLPLLRPPIVIKDDAWLGADSFVGPSVIIHEGVIVGARASVFKDLAPWGVYAGNPARRLRDRSPMISREPPKPEAEHPPHQ